ncbi:MAG: ribulose-phosphate 3-epimerase [Pirellulales bacterium]|nr:ribulose-phosphate 3-epimerase [Pirellulales bacterium]
MARGTLFDRLRGMCPTISVGVLTADWMRLESQLGLIADAGVEVLHFDVMDGRFCPMMTLGPPIVKAVKTDLIKDVHLMVEDPMARLAEFVAVGADILTFNLESCLHLHRALEMLGQMENANDPARGVVRGVSLNPATPVEMIEPVIDEIDLVVLLAVNPGWKGQTLVDVVRLKIERLNRMAAGAGRDIMTCFDGGVRKDNLARIAATGPDLIVTGSAVFDGKAPRENAREMLDILKTSRAAT